MCGGAPVGQWEVRGGGGTPSLERRRVVRLDFEIAIRPRPASLRATPGLGDVAVPTVDLNPRQTMNALTSALSTVTLRSADLRSVTFGSAALFIVVLSTISFAAPSPTAAQTPSDGAPQPLETVQNFQIVTDRLASAGQIDDAQVPLIRERGYDVVVNLAIADEDRNGREGFLVAREGMTYVHIPVDWNEPQVSDVAQFLDVMEANRDRKVFVHCFANMRASVFVYLYRTLVEGVDEADARATLNEVWDPAEQSQWADLIERAKVELAAR